MGKVKYPQISKMRKIFDTLAEKQKLDISQAYRYVHPVQVTHDDWLPIVDDIVNKDIIIKREVYSLSTNDYVLNPCEYIENRLDINESTTLSAKLVLMEKGMVYVVVSTRYNGDKKIDYSIEVKTYFKK